MQQFDILDPELNIFRNYFLEASAGTGKTFAIEHLVVRLLLESEEPIDLKEILAVTFTKEAAHEMKTRIRRKLETLLPENNRRVREALINFDEIQVFTIHGFCHRMLTEFAFEAAAPLKMSSPDQPDHIAEMAQIVTDFFKTAGKEFEPEISALMKRMRFDLGKLTARIVAAMEKDEKPRSIPFPELPKISLEQLRDDFLTLAPRYKRLKVEEHQYQLEKFVAFLDQNEKQLLTEESEWFFEKMHEGNCKVRAEPLANYSLRSPYFFEILQEKLVPYLEVERDPEEMVKRIAKECRDRWHVKAARSDKYTFDDLLKKMEAALDAPLFVEKVRAKYKAAIVDEFQDTDPIQWRIFEQLFLKSNHLIYLVGDPKQSIYGFRSADIYTYMNAANALGPDKKAFLDTNFRSRPELIDSLNSLFTHRPEWISLPSMPGALQYHPVKAGRKESKLNEPPIHYFGAKGEQGREKSWPTKQMEEEKLFPFIASEILRLHTEHGTSFSEMAILIKDRYQAQRMQLHLNLWKIPSSLKQTFSLTDSRGFAAMEILLKATARPDNESLVHSALYGLAMDEKENPFYSFKQLFQEKGFASLFAEFTAKHFRSHGDPTLYLELRQTAEILMEHGAVDLEDLLHLMQELKKSNPEIDARLKLRGEEGEERVPIMTTFGSKGLEFEVVFALGMASRHQGDHFNADKEAEKMRQLYVAFTRSREKLYIPILHDLAQKPISPGCGSPIELFFADRELPIEWIETIPIKQHIEERREIKLIAPRKIELDYEPEYLTSFTAMSKAQGPALLTECYRMQDFSVKTAHTLPIGAETGVVIHKVFETHFHDLGIPLEQVILEVVNGTHLEGWEAVIEEIVQETLNMPLIGNFSLSMLKEGEYFQEMEFLFPKGNQLIKGFVDLVFQIEDTFYIVDWKTNWLGPAESAYSQEKLHAAMLEHDYYLQAELYGEALERYVKQFYTDPKFGGAYYLFVRGKKGVHVGNR